MKAILRGMSRRIYYIIAIACFVLLAIALLIANQHPASGYELSIYAATPLAVWICLSLAFAGGVIIITYQVAAKAYENSRFWLIGLLILLTARVSLLCLPYARGYVTWWGDNLTHWGMVGDILNTGHFHIGNYYPITHILASEVITITGAPQGIILNLSTVFFSVILVLSTYLLSTVVLRDRGMQLLATAASAAVIFNDWEVFLRPAAWAYLLTPLVLFLFFKHSSAHRTLLIIFLVLLVFLHMFGSFALIVAFITIGLSWMILTLIYNIKAKRSFTTKLFTGFPLNLILISFAALFTWISLFPLFRQTVLNIFWAITGETTIGLLPMFGESLGKLNVTGFEIIWLAFKLYGEDIIYGVLSLIAGIIIIRWISSNRIKNPERIKGFLSLLSIIAVFLLLYVVYAFRLMPGVDILAAERFLRYAVLLMPIATGFVLYQLIKTHHLVHLASIVTVVVIIAASTFSMLGIYRSPWTMQASIGMTQMDMSGMAWFIEKKDRAIGYIVIRNPPFRVADAILGTIESDQRKDIPHIAPHIPDHFNYGKYTTLGESYDNDKYAVLAESDRIVYVTVWEEVGRFNKADFESLQYDPTVDKLYSNGETDVWYIRAQGEEE